MQGARSRPTAVPAPTIPVNPTSLNGGGQRLHCPPCLLALFRSVLSVCQGRVTGHSSALESLSSAHLHPFPSAPIICESVHSKVEANRICTSLPSPGAASTDSVLSTWQAPFSHAEL